MKGEGTEKDERKKERKKEGKKERKEGKNKVGKWRNKSTSWW